MIHSTSVPYFSVAPKTRAQRVGDAISLGLRWTLVGVMTAMTVLVFVNVVLRYVYGTSILWAEETSRFLMIWMTFISSGLVLRHGGHMSIDAIFGWTNVRWHKPLRTFNLTVIIGLSIVICYVGIAYALRSMSQTTPTTGIPFGFVYLGIPLGSSFMVILGLIDFKRHISGEHIEDPDGFDPHIGDTSTSGESN